ncbi:amidohydrolase [Flocculibacter collagenilyticus]|uniref:amidohydrolase n=1 Tax=Flocculibacter collagenilyticus TaxID=2744479 RepID=UPI001F452690|nr:amidohydrolase [Flocculibacter collagenilyticus]
MMKESIKMLIPCTLAASLGLFGCTGSDVDNDGQQPELIDKKAATMVFTNGNVYTVNKNSPWASAVVINNGKIVYVGDDSHAEQYIGNNTEVINLNGKMMMPGIHDVHIHPLESGSDATHFSLNEHESNAENYIDEIADAAYLNPNATWLIGYGHSIMTLLEAERSPRDILDDAVPNRPVIIMEQTSHSMWLNSKALELAGISAQSDDPTGGVISRDSNGIPNGILYDNAGNMVMEIAMREQTNTAQKDYLGLVEYTMPELNKHGITSISDARTYWQRGHLETWQRVADNDELTLRVSLGLWAYPEKDDAEQINQIKALYQADSANLLKVNQVKFYMDGILVNTTAAMHEPYHQNWLGTPNNNGVNYFTQQRMEKYIEALEPTGFDFNIHAIGDRGITEALNAIENASQGKARHRLTHVEVVDPQDYERFNQLNVIADAQVAGDFANPAHWSENIDLIGEERSTDLVPIKSLVEHNATLTLSSDWNVSHFNPFLGISNAITRAPQAITLEQAINAYTINAAYAMRQDDIVGSIEIGKRADLIVLDRNLFNSTAAQIKNTKVTLTLLDGEVVYAR